MVVIPPPSAKIHSNDYITYEEPLGEDGAEAFRKRKRGGEASSGANLLQARDQRAVSDEILRQLQDLMQDIFEAEDQTQMDTAGDSSSIPSQHFVSASHEGREVLSLSPAIHIKLESLLHKSINADRFGEIDVEHLQRLYRLCEGALTSADSANLHIDTGWDAENFTSWISRLDAADAGLRSARTILRVMTGGRDDKELYSEELLQNILTITKKVLDICVIPIVEFRSSGSTSAIFEGVSIHKKVLSQLVFDTNKVMALLVKLLAKIEMAEIIITGIEFFAIPLLFVENAHNEKESVLGVQKFENLRRTSMDQISIIFSRYPDQRSFLLNEVLTSLQRLPVNEKHARQYKLPEGKTIMLVSALIMQLVQISAKHSTAATEKPFHKAKPTTMRDHEHESGSSDEESAESTPAPAKYNKSDRFEGSDDPHDNTTLQHLSKDANFLVDNATKSAQFVTSFLVQRASNTAKSSESPHRQHLDIFVQDLIAVLGIPEWPAAELLLRMVFASCRQIAENPKSLAPAKNMALELLGMMGSAISDLVSSTRHASRSLDDEDSEFSRNLRQMLDDYLDGSLEGNELVAYHGPYHAVAEYLGRSSSADVQSASAQAYYVAQWSRIASSGDLKIDPDNGKLILKLQKMLSGAGWAMSE